MVWSLSQVVTALQLVFVIMRFSTTSGLIHTAATKSCLDRRLLAVASTSSPWTGTARTRLSLRHELPAFVGFEALSPSRRFLSNSPITTFSSSSTARRASLSLASSAEPASSSADTKSATPLVKLSTQQQNQQNQQPIGKKSSASSTLRNTGGLRALPVVKSPVELMDKARKVAKAVKPDAKENNIRHRARKHGTETLNALTQALCVPLRDVVNGYQSVWRRLHPFERVVADLTVRARQRQDGLTLQGILDEIHEARKILLETGKEWISKVKNAESAKEAGETLTEGTNHLFELYKQFASPAVLNIMALQRELRSAPIVALDTPAVVLVGAPNVGKSSIVRAISSGTPEVNNYPFTTRGMTLGHVEVFWSLEKNHSIAKAVVPDETRKPGAVSTDVLLGKYAFSQLCQIMDSPGLLVRPDSERNEMEALTLAAMQHLPTAVMYVMDLSGNAGDKCSSIEDQLQLRREVRARFPKRPWIDVVSKVDLGVDAQAIETLERDILKGDPYILLSIHTGTGLQELRSQVLRMLGEVRVVLDALAALEMQQQQQQLLQRENSNTARP